MRRITKKILVLLAGVSLMVLYCEFLIYYVVISQCYWPALTQSNNEGVLKVLMLTDIHMYGRIRGNKAVDQWRREWQMHQAFRAIISLHNPEVVFVLGDIFDEGEYSNDKQFDDLVKRFYKQFYVPNHIQMYIVAGNHDIGFHNNIKRGHVERYYKALNTTSAQLLTLKNNHFVLINSVAMEGDNCSLCRNARKQVEDISDKLKCAENLSQCKTGTSNIMYSQPILIQHFPMYRESDAICTEPDKVPWYEKDIPFRHKIDDLSEEATNYLATKLKPRAAFGGHTHYGCLVNHKYKDPAFEFLEYSIPSFSWRNIFTPKYMLMSVTPSGYAVNKCGLPGEHTMVITAVLILATTVYIVRRKL